MQITLKCMTCGAVVDNGVGVTDQRQCDWCVLHNISYGEDPAQHTCAICEAEYDAQVKLQADMEMDQLYDMVEDEDMVDF